MPAIGGDLFGRQVEIDRPVLLPDFYGKRSGFRTCGKGILRDARWHQFQLVDLLPATIRSSPVSRSERFGRENDGNAEYPNTQISASQHPGAL